MEEAVVHRFIVLTTAVVVAVCLVGNLAFARKLSSTGSASAGQYQYENEDAKDKGHDSEDHKGKGHKKGKGKGYLKVG
jgi:hypothetical protein